MRTTVDVAGFRDLDRALGELPRATAKNVLRRVAKAELEPLANRAAQKAPEESGRLAFSITVSERGTRRAEWYRRRQPHEFVMAMGPASGLGALYYATHVEFGTVDTPAQPYMRPTWDSGANPMQEGIRTRLWEEIRKAAARAARRATRRAGRG